MLSAIHGLKSNAHSALRLSSAANISSFFFHFANISLMNFSCFFDTSCLNTSSSACTVFLSADHIHVNKSAHHWTALNIGDCVSSMTHSYHFAYPDGLKL